MALAMILDRTFRYAANGRGVARLVYHVDEATEEQAASDDGGRPSDVDALLFTCPSDGVLLVAPGPADHAIIQASLDGATGPWTDITTGSLVVVAAEGEDVPVWVRLLVLNWGGAGALDSPEDRYALRIVSERPAYWRPVA